MARPARYRVRDIWIAASTAKAPLPWTGTAACACATPANAARRARTPSLIAVNAASQDPQSRPSAARAWSDVVNGPGVSSSGVTAVSGCQKT
jgi:hypothetical protein